MPFFITLVPLPAPHHFASDDVVQSILWPSCVRPVADAPAVPSAVSYSCIRSRKAEKGPTGYAVKTYPFAYFSSSCVSSLLDHLCHAHPMSILLSLCCLRFEPRSRSFSLNERDIWGLVSKLNTSSPLRRNFASWHVRCFRASSTWVLWASPLSDPDSGLILAREACEG